MKARERLAKWVRELGITDPEVQPNHGWRHSFKQIGHRNEISERIDRRHSRAFTVERRTRLRHANAERYGGGATQVSEIRDLITGYRRHRACEGAVGNIAAARKTLLICAALPDWRNREPITATRAQRLGSGPSMLNEATGV